jgi:hypothetical protein
MFPSVTEHRVELDSSLWLVASNGTELPLLIAHHVRDLDQSHYDLLAGFARGEYPSEAVSDPRWVVTVDGAVTSFPSDGLDEYLVSELRSAEASLYSSAAQFVETYRWRVGTPPNLSVRYPLAREWRPLDDEAAVWHPLPHLVAPRSIAPPYVEPSEPSRGDDVELDWAALYRDRPLAAVSHDLLADAYQVTFESQLILSIAAMEMATKVFISRWAPDAKWFVADMPAPALDKMLTHYLPTMSFPNKPADDHPIPEHLRTEIANYLEMRDWLVHRGDIGSRTPAVATSGRPPRFACDVARDLLYRLDYYSGHDWARQAFEDRVTDARPSPHGHQEVHRPAPA